MIILRIIASIFPLIFMLPFAYWGIVSFLTDPKEFSSWENLLRIGGGALVVGASLTIVYFCISFIRGKDHPVHGSIIILLNALLFALVLLASFKSGFNAEILFPLSSLIAAIISFIKWRQQSRSNSSRDTHAA